VERRCLRPGRNGGGGGAPSENIEWSVEWPSPPPSISESFLVKVKLKVKGRVKVGIKAASPTTRASRRQKSVKAASERVKAASTCQHTAL
jgi:hypothetical protein